MRPERKATITCASTRNFKTSLTQPTAAVRRAFSPSRTRARLSAEKPVPRSGHGNVDAAIRSSRDTRLFARAGPARVPQSAVTISDRDPSEKYRVLRAILRSVCVFAVIMVIIGSNRTVHGRSAAREKRGYWSRRKISGRCNAPITLHWDVDSGARFKPATSRIDSAKLV